jgi:DNA-binding transcriptional LysR family regulator
VIKSEHIEQNMSGLTFEPLIQGKIVVGVDRQSPYALQKSITAEQFKREMLVIYQDDYVQWFIGEFQKKYGSANIIFTSNNTDALQSAVFNHRAMTIGIDFSFAPSITKSNAGMITLELQDVEQQPVYLGWVRSETKHFSGIIKSFITRLKNDIQ